MSLSLGSDATALLAQLELPNAQEAPRIWVALSGGVDSSVLAEMAVRRWPGKVRLVHINHHLQSESDTWAEHCRQLATRLSVPITVVDVVVTADGGLENAAREARYAAFEDILKPGDLLLLAHHADDQIETVFYRLLRGAGLDGLSGMPDRRALGAGQLWRPWLDVPRSQIIQVAQALGISWVEDPSNQEIQADRNFLRQRVLPLLEERWPQYRVTVSRARHHIAQAAQREQVHWQHQLKAVLESGTLPVAAIRQSSDPEALVRAWLRDLTPRQHQIQVVLYELVDAAVDAQPEVKFRTTIVRRFQDRLYRVAQRPPVPQHPLPISVGDTLVDRSFGSVELIAGSSASHMGLALDAATLAHADLNIRFRRGGERLHPRGRNGSRDLKRLLQEWQVPPWERNRLPLLYLGERLVAVACPTAPQGWFADEFLPTPIEPAAILCYRIVPS